VFKCAEWWAEHGGMNTFIQIYFGGPRIWYNYVMMQQNVPDQMGSDKDLMHDN